MVGPAQPSNFEGLTIVVVMAVRLWAATDLARLSGQKSAAQSLLVFCVSRALNLTEKIRWARNTANAAWTGSIFTSAAWAFL